MGNYSLPDLLTVGFDGKRGSSQLLGVDSEHPFLEAPRKIVQPPVQRDIQLLCISGSSHPCLLVLRERKVSRGGAGSLMFRGTRETESCFTAFPQPLFLLHLSPFFSNTGCLSAGSFGAHSQQDPSTDWSHGLPSSHSFWLH